MDDLDENLVSLLTSNARLPVAVLAKRLAVARSTVQARLDRLESNGVIAGYTVRMGEGAQARRLMATVLIQVEPRATAAVVQRLRSMPQVIRAVTTSGRFDLVLTVAAATTEELDQTLDSLGAVPGVLSSESMIHLTSRIDRGA
ncbi:MAG: Lrp/AsnC family transcriptional regulator [Rhodobacteraceae bacterium]|nr:Lrp/AsnC family transcriptional regulator [Alphaproteobacteria bacterium]NNF70974.1 Lrp/AsnC family transcriptional regulator [Paracoccaceae bacterium]NNK67281.1 Lrp/AsnC family transcriptional regulator [Paracoccaceae bacterium]